VAYTVEFISVQIKEASRKSPNFSSHMRRLFVVIWTLIQLLSKHIQVSCWEMKTIKGNAELKEFSFEKSF